MQRVISSAFCFFLKILYTYNRYIIGFYLLTIDMNAFDNIDDGHYKNVSVFFKFLFFVTEAYTLA